MSDKTPCSPKAGRAGASERSAQTKIDVRYKDPALDAYLATVDNKSSAIRNLIAIGLAVELDGSRPPPIATFKDAARQITGLATNVNQVVSRVHMRGENAAIEGAVVALQDDVKEMVLHRDRMLDVVNYWRRFVL